MSVGALAGRDFLSLLDFEREELERLLDLAAEVKSHPGRFARALEGRTLFMYFEKPSLRTRVTFETGMTQLGGHAIYYTAAEGRIGVRETVADVARNLERWVDAATCRTFRHELVEALARATRIPVINALTDLLHPCQALGDFFTLRERHGHLEGLRLVYVGDGNNVAHALLEGGARLGVDVTVVTPPGYEPRPEIVRAAREIARASGARLEVSHDLEQVAGADAVYTDVWASMGQEEEAEARRRAFRAYQVDARLMERAGPRAWFMHCLPAHRGEEVTDEVIDSPRSIVFDQAENRLHTQKAILLALLGRS